MDILKPRKNKYGEAQPNKFDKECEKCGDSMIGVIKENTQPNHPDTINRPARKVCIKCQVK